MTIYRNLTFAQQREIPDPKNVEGDGTGFYTVWNEDDYTSPEPIIIEPIIVNMAQAKLALFDDGKLADFETAYAAAYAAAPPKVRIVFDTVIAISSDSEVANSVLESIGYDSNQRLELFARAAQIDPASVTE